ncbi:2EXR family [Microdochium nivale]|nr:2EXR family [Microdochium nivale]
MLLRAFVDAVASEDDTDVGGEVSRSFTVFGHGERLEVWLLLILQTNGDRNRYHQHHYPHPPRGQQQQQQRLQDSVPKSPAASSTNMTFLRFPELPFELQHKIWHHALAANTTADEITSPGLWTY